MDYIEMTADEAIEVLRNSKDKKVLVAIQDLESDEPALFYQRLKIECESMIAEAKTVSSMCDGFVKQLNAFTEKQNIYNIEPHGIQKTILIKV